MQTTIAPRRINANIFINVRDEYTQKAFIKAIEDNVWDVFTTQALAKLQKDINDQIQKGVINNSGLEEIKTDLAHLKKVVVIGDDSSKSLFYVRENLRVLFEKGVGHKYIARTGSPGAYKYEYRKEKKPSTVKDKFEQTYSKEQAKVYAEGGVPLTKEEEYATTTFGIPKTRVSAFVDEMDRWKADNYPPINLLDTVKSWGSRKKGLNEDILFGKVKYMLSNIKKS